MTYLKHFCNAMVSIDTLKSLAMSLPEVTEQPHFEKISFRVNNKIFATYDATHHTATIKLSTNEQDVFSLISNGTIRPVQNKWRKQGWTIIQMEEISADIFNDAITMAYCTVAPDKLSALVRRDK